jgi:DNA processing protein
MKPNILDLDPNSVKDAEEQLGISAQELADIFLLLSVKGLGPQKFKAIHKRGFTYGEIISKPSLLPIPGLTGEKLQGLIKQISDSTKQECLLRAKKQLVVALKNNSKILTYRNSFYPKLLFHSNYPVPVIYAKGSWNILKNEKAVACVGSRGIREPYSICQKRFATFAAGKGYNIVSGFALGADTIAHRSAFECGGATVCVVPSGLDRPFPPENKDFWNEISNYSKGILVSEFPFGTGANSLNLKKRNKMIVAFANGVLVGQSAKDGGAMNAYRFAREQKKPVATFLSDGKEDTSGNSLIQLEKQNDDSIFSVSSDSDSYSSWLSRLSFLI